MSKTLENVSHESLEQGGAGESRIKRLLMNCWKAAGLFTPDEKTIQGRIYLSYVLGQLVATVKFGWRKLDLDRV